MNSHEGALELKSQLPCREDYACHGGDKCRRRKIAMDRPSTLTSLLNESLLASLHVRCNFGASTSAWSIWRIDTSDCCHWSHRFSNSGSIWLRLALLAHVRPILSYCCLFLLQFLFPLLHHDEKPLVIMFYFLWLHVNSWHSQIWDWIWKPYA